MRQKRWCSVMSTTLQPKEVVMDMDRGVIKLPGTVRTYFIL